MTRLSLTTTQARLYGFIAAEIAAGRSPSFDELAAFMGTRSKGNIHRLVSGLEERGWIVRLGHRARAIALATEEAPRPPRPSEPRRLGIPGPVAAQLIAYCDRRRLAARDVLSAALLAYIEEHP